MNNTKVNEEISRNVMKSGTSIVGIVCKDGVVMAGDRRATVGGSIIMRKNEPKIHRINDYLLSAGTGTASDIMLSGKIASAELRLKELKTKSRPSVREAASLIAMNTYRNIRSPSMIPSIVGSLIGGVDEDGQSFLFTIEPAGGAMLVEDYDANFSSGMPYILGLLERTYRKDILVKDAVELAKDCIKVAIERDTASGNGIDVFTITKEGIKHVVSEEIIPQYK